MVLYLKVTRDKYELPVAVADTKAELARMLGVKPSAIAHGTNMKWGKPSYVVVEVNENEDNN